ncbi:MAG: peptidoglycan DD-metalloendopeptidase family protein [Arcobacteraceae bacterium]|nr:peptidoglycan DD-metalloendopeptidase family protein [Arcobacteraceae bacterium]
MFKILIVIFCLFGFAFAGTNEDLEWSKGESFLSFLTKYKINKDIYFNLSKTDKELCTEIEAGAEYRLILADNGSLLHALIPISEEMQIHLYRAANNIDYILDIIPVIYDTRTELLTFNLESSPYQDIVNLTKNKQLANEFIKAFQKSVNFKKVHKDDIVAIKYEQKIRLGKYYGTPVVLGAFVRLKHQEDKYVFQNLDEGVFYDDSGKSLTGVLFKVPLNYKRISSIFTYKRYHPVLKIYRAHLGVDFAAPMGTKVWSTGNGKISFFGRKGGYGNVIIVNHEGGFKSLYGHLSAFNKKFRSGSTVKQGDILGYVGTSGVSSGPHLHFGMYKNVRAMDPMKILSSSKKSLSGKARKTFMANVTMIKKELENALKNGQVPFKLESIPLYSKLKK